MALVPPSIASLRVGLASGSKERLTLLEQIGMQPTVRISNYDENLNKDLVIDEFVREIAHIKAATIAKLMDTKDYDVIIGCVTVVLFDNDIIGKPVDEQDARATLQSGRAGSYGIQACGGIFVEKIDGCYYNAVGSPINRLMRVPWKRVI
ncbi:maf-like protein [Loa loa]|uniref:Maf-like protein n=1 Tax=Loa loa TaxID=7209 RepID=A0A1S0U368_LOALO|nr:maf-like protein [Loa loa]EFO24302.2 maf-like protein [Loa loa]